MIMLDSNVLIKNNTVIEVPFYDVDVMGIVWHGNYLKYFEVGRCSLLNDIHYDYFAMEKSGYLWPVVDTQIKFIQPAFF